MVTTEIPVRPEPPAPAPKRTGRKWALRIVLAILIFAVLLVFAAVAFVWWTDSKIERIPASELTSLQAAEGGPRNILMVGTDSRENLPDDFENFGNFSGSRTDVIMLVHFVPGEGAQLLSIPRDLKVDFDDAPTNRINTAYVIGGPDLLVETVQDVTGVAVNNYVEIDFVGFAAVVDSLGGVEIDFECAARDTKSGFVADAGKQTLDGEMAVAYVRSRSYQENCDGSWDTDGSGDIGRTGRQQALLLAVFDQASSPSSAFNAPRFASTFAEQIRADEGLSAGVILDLGRSALSLNRSSIHTATLPVKNHSEGGRSYVIMVQPDADEVLTAFINGDPFPS